ncbi:MAG: heme A synthase [Boseongicola sp.]|nr:MAG: heme A synthase [Boseongicola sp.]
MSEKRSIFEEVGSNTKPVEAPKGGVIDSGKKGARGAIRAWLMVLFALVVVMIAVGGLTRLTDSGLSITEWKPVTGAMPPTSEAAWQAEFDKYREIPEYRLQNKGMTLAEFKTIYWWEWGHRQLGRVIGLVWAVGFFYFLARSQIPNGWTGRLVGLGALGGLQGAIGWWMVSSGLEGTMLDVASYRLAVHLGLAFVILGLIAWYVFHLGRRDADLLQARRGGEQGLMRLGAWLAGLTFVQILLGALVAGIDAGLSFTDWPLMGGQFFPEGAFFLEPAWRNFFESPGFVQFLHRMTAYGLILFTGIVWWRSRASGNDQTRFAFNVVLAAICFQLVLGVLTLLYFVPWQLAILHQLGAVLLFVVTLRARFLAQYPLSQSIRG